jgi:hypothetical protein
VVGSFFWKSSKALDSSLYLMSSRAAGPPSLVVSSFFWKSSKALDSGLLYLMSSRAVGPPIPDGGLLLLEELLEELQGTGFWILDSYTL